MTTSSLTNPLDAGTHTVEIDGVVQRYHVHGTGPVCVAHSGGPGIFWEYLRMPALERHLTMVYPEPVGTGASGKLPSHPHGYTRPRYSQFLGALIDHLGVPEVHLLGHSHGGFVVQYHALNHPERIAGVILYDSAPLTGPEHGAEAMRLVQLFAERHADHPGLTEVLAAFQAISTISDDAQMTAVARGLLPSYFADYWGREEEFAPLRASVRATHISGLDENLAPHVIDDRADLGSLTVPALVVVGRHDVICGVRWAEELHALIPGSELLILENSGHFGHIEEPEAFSRAVTRFVN
ncbi:alpha/beta hydrolase [Streptomyces phaeochromogenes]|uniref:alpha/beta fold hydrolase n=1 Tax=Streptomyces phaeochromogenes TaxID=1923 RepID=UPI002DD81B84|nr:alpha/beta hydrolase [Streptomyces phaeochromogenes]WRZ26978.1 alpha/beta hydrolase [Streptomyces phaeochromogenes]